MAEYVQLVKRDICINKIRDILEYTLCLEEKTPEEEIYEKIKDNICEMEKRIGASRRTIKGWLEGKSRPSSDYLQKILTEYNLIPKDLGVDIIKLSDFSERLKILRDEKGFNNKQLSRFLEEENEELYASESSVYNWIKGTKTPNMSTIFKIADIFEVHYLYLLGVIDEKKPTFSIINKLIGIDEETSTTLLEYKTMSQYGQNFRDYIEEEYGFTYKEVVQEVIQDVQFIDAIYFEIYRILAYRLTGYKDSFDDFMNTIELDFNAKELGTDTIFGSMPKSVNTFVTQEEISKLIINKRLEGLLNKMIEKYQNIANENMKNN